MVWVDGKLPFGDGVPYNPEGNLVPSANDLEPASFGVQGMRVELEGVKLWRDSYYTSRDRPLPESLRGLQWLPVRILRVPDGHYLCLGDNSANSSDSRSWGTVPRRLLLGRALLVYWPFNRIGLIR